MRICRGFLENRGRVPRTTDGRPYGVRIRIGAEGNRVGLYRRADMVIGPYGRVRMRRGVRWKIVGGCGRASSARPYSGKG